ENAGQVNAYMTLNIRGKRSKTDRVDNDAKMMDAFETARAQDEYFARTGNFVGPLHGIPFAVKDNFDTVDMRTTAGAAADYANDKPPRDATMVAKLRAAGAIILGKTNLDEYAPAGIGRSTRGGPMCRTVEDTAAVLEVLTGDDPRDAITAVAQRRQPVVYSNYTGRRSLAGKRLGVVRDFMIEATIADRENIRIGNEALADMK